MTADETVPSLLAVRDLEVAYGGADGGAVRVLDGAALDLREGDTLGVLGESGCGKTTLARAILGILPPGASITSGSIRLEGRELVGLPESELERIRGRHVAMIFQEPGLALSPVLRVGHQIGDALRFHLGTPPGERRGEVVTLLERVRFADPERVFDAYPHQLSGGQLQRVVLARAIAGRPRVLLADEPTSAVDATVQRELLAILAGLREELGLTLLFISHDPALLAEIAGRIAVMYAGRVIELGAREEVFTRPLHPYTRALLQCAPRAAESPRRRLAAIPGEPPDPSRPSAGCRFEPRCAERLDECAERFPAAVSPRPKHRVSCFLHGG